MIKTVHKQEVIETTVIIVNWNTKIELNKCLSSLMQYTDSKKVKIIVVDNASKDGSREMVINFFPVVQLINSGRNIGFAKANNLALSQVKSPFVFFLNPDTQVYKNTIQQMVDFLKSNPNVGAVGCKMKDPHNESLSHSNTQTLPLQWKPSPFRLFLKSLFLNDKIIEKYKKYLPYHCPEKSGYVKQLNGGSLMIRKKVLDQVGYFDERFFMYAEDGDLCIRILDGGWKLYYLSEAEISHVCGATKKIATKNFSSLMMCESVSKYMLKYYGNTGKLLYQLIILFSSFLKLITLRSLKFFSYYICQDYKNDYSNSISKYYDIFQWSLGIKKPEIIE